MRSGLSVEKYGVIRGLHISDYIAREDAILSPEDYQHLLEIFLAKYQVSVSKNIYNLKAGNKFVKILRPDNELLSVCKVEDFAHAVSDILSNKRYGAEKSLKSVLSSVLAGVQNGQEVVILIPLNYDLDKWLTGQVVVTKAENGAIFIKSDVFAKAETFFAHQVLAIINSIVEQYPEVVIVYGEVNSIPSDETDFFANIGFVQNAILALKLDGKIVLPKARDQLDLLAGSRQHQSFDYEKVSLNGEIEEFNPFLLLLPLISHVEHQYDVFQRLRSFLQLTEQTVLFKELEAAFAFIQRYQSSAFLQMSEIKRWSLENFAYQTLVALDGGKDVQVRSDGFDIFINFVEQILNITGRQEEAKAFKDKFVKVKKDWYLRAENWSLQSQLAVIENVKNARSIIELDQTLIHQHGYFDVAAILDSVSIMEKVLSFNSSDRAYPINHAIINDSINTFKAFLEAQPSLISQTNAQGNIMHLVMGSVFINGDSRFEILNYLISNHSVAVKEMLKAQNQLGLRPLDVMPGVNSLYALKVIMNRVKLGIDLNNPEDFKIFADINGPYSLDEREKLTRLYNHYFQFAPALTGEFNLSEAIDSAKLAHIWNWLNSKSFDPDLQEFASPSLTLALFTKDLKEQTSEWLQLFVDHGVGLNYEESPAYDMHIRKPVSALYCSLSQGLLLEAQILVNAGVVFKTEHLSWIPDGHPEMSEFVKLQAEQKIKPGYELLRKILDRGDKPLKEVLTNEYVSSLYQGSDQIEELSAIKEALFISKGSGKKKKKILKDDLTALQVLQIIPATFPESLSMYNPPKELITDRLFYCARNGQLKELFYLLKNYPDIADVRNNAGEFLVENVIKNYALTNSNAIKVIDLLITFEFSLETSVSKPFERQKKSGKQGKHKMQADSDTAPIMKLAAEKGLKDVVDLLHLRGVCFTDSAYQLIPEALKANFADHKARLDKDKEEANAQAKKSAQAADQLAEWLVAEETKNTNALKGGGGKEKAAPKRAQPKPELVSKDTKSAVIAKQTGLKDVKASEPEAKKDTISPEDMAAIERALKGDEEEEWITATQSRRKQKSPSSSKGQIHGKGDEGKTRTLTNLHDVQQPRQNLKLESSRKLPAATDAKFKNAAATEHRKIEEKDPISELNTVPTQSICVEASQKQTDKKPQLRKQQEVSADSRVMIEMQNKKIDQLEAHIFGKFHHVVKDEATKTISLFSNNAALKTAFVTGFNDYKFSFCEFIEQNKLHANLQEFRAAVIRFVENYEKPIEEFEKRFRDLYEMSERMAVHLKHSQKRDYGSGI